MMEKYLTDTVKRPALEQKMYNANLIKGYIYTLDSIEREKDRIRWEMKMADKQTKEKLRKQADTVIVDRMLENFYNIKSSRATH